MDDQWDDFFNVNKDPVSEVSKKKTFLDTDSESDSEAPKPSFLKKATLSDSGTVFITKLGPRSGSLSS